MVALILSLFLAQAQAKPATVPFELLPTRHMIVKVKINGKGPYRFLFDTGAPLNIVGLQAARESAVAAPAGTSRTLAGTLEMGDLKAEKVPVVVVDHPAVTALSRVGGGPVHGIVGFPFFARYRLTLDYQAKRLTFVPNGFEPADTLQTLMDFLTKPAPTTPPVLAPAAQWGLVVDRTDDDPGVTVKEVLADSAAAEAGVKAGDRLLTIDGRWTDSIADCCRAASHVAPGQAVPVVVRRAGKEVTLAIKPRIGI